ncbi:MAG: hypothetical protein F4059_07035, partial [Gemmatimonadetes bacterium]|nr:hypothetical protein [Gemmatimonadota bacterium]
MIWDPCLARAVAAELGERLTGSRARALWLRREAMEVLVWFRDATLGVDLSPGRGQVVLGAPAEPDSEAEPLPAVLAGVEAVPDERVIVMRFRRVRGRKPHPVLILELATNRWNAILADGPQQRVRKRLRAFRTRPLPVGQPWKAPGDEGSGRKRELVDPGRWRELVGAADPEARSALLRAVAYLSGLNIGHVLNRGSPEESFRRWRTMAEGTEVRPHLLHPPSGPQPYPWPLEGVEGEPLASLLEGMRVLREADPADPEAERGQVARRLAAEARRLLRKIANLRRQLEKAGQAQQLREEAALVLSSLHLIERGAGQVTLADFDGVERTLVLDPLLRPQEHANAMFRRAARLERAATELPGRIRAAEATLSEITTLQA